MKRYNFVVRDAAGRTWGRGDSMSDVEASCCRGRTAYMWNGYEYQEITDCEWMTRERMGDDDVFIQPKNFRGDWIVTSRFGVTIASAHDKESLVPIAIAGLSRALWEYIHESREYMRHRLPGRVSHVSHGGCHYRRPVEPRDVWLVTAASGRVWARGARVEDVLVAASEGNKRALWQLVGGEYVLRAVGGVWIA